LGEWMGEKWIIVMTGTPFSIPWRNVGLNPESRLERNDAKKIHRIPLSH